jgi:hypothetical protein
MAVKKGELKHIHVEPDTAKGSRGAHVTVVKHVSEGKNKGPWLKNEDEERQSHPTPEATAAHVLKSLHEHFGSNTETKNTPTPGVKEGKSAAAKESHPISDDGPNPSSDSWD